MNYKILTAILVTVFTTFVLLPSSAQALETHPSLFLSPERLSNVENNYDNGNGDFYVYMKSRLDGFLTRIPYNATEYAATYAFAAMITDDQSDKTAYTNKAIDLVWNDKDVFNLSNTWYQNRNGFRANNIWPCLVFDWAYHDLSAEQKEEALDAFSGWGEYWAAYVNYDADPDFSSYNPRDSDELTSLAENFLLLGLVLSDEAGYESQGTRMLAIADSLLNNIIIDKYLDDYMAGGVWAEGTDYSPATSRHWISAFLLNKELRNIPYPSSYQNDALKFMIHSTYPTYSGIFMYGDIEGLNVYDGLASDYPHPEGEYRYDYMLFLTDLVDDPNLKALGQYWMNEVEAKHGVPSGSGDTALWRMLFERPDATALSPADISLPLYFKADGLKLVTFRENWGDNSSVLYFQNTEFKVDHMQKSALSFDIIRNGRVVTKEHSGYGGVANSTIAHNSLLIENKDSWNNDVTGRAIGDGEILAMESNDDYAYVAAEAANIYNYGQWHGISYVDNVQRKILWIKPGYVLVKDYVKLVDDGIPAYSGAGFDANTYDGHKRRIKYVQHFQVEPNDVLGDGVYSASSEGQKLFFKTVTPDSVTTERYHAAVTEPFTSAPPYQSPDNQKMKWFITAIPNDAQNETNMLHALYFDDDTVNAMPATSKIESGNGNMIGALIEDSSTPRVAMFSSNISSINSTSYSANYSASLSGKHTLVDIDPGTYDIYKNGSVIQTNVAASNEGVLSFSALGGGLFSITQTGSAPPQVIRADVNNDGTIDSSDYLLIIRRSFNMSMSGTGWYNSSTTGDANCDGEVNIKDALLSFRYSLGLNMDATSWCE